MAQVAVSVTGGLDSTPIGRPEISNSVFTRAIVKTISKSQLFSNVTVNPNEKDYLLEVTLFSMDKRVFGQTVKLEAGWTLRRASNKTVVWQQSIKSEYIDASVQVATEGTARNNIAQALGRISKLNLDN